MIHPARRLPAFVVIALVAAACGDDTEQPAGDAAADTATPDDTAAPEDTVAPVDSFELVDNGVWDTVPPVDTHVAEEVAQPCTRSGFVAVAEDAGMFLGAFTYVAQSTLAAPVDVLNIELVAAAGGATGPGSYPLDDTNYATCGACVLIFAGCDEDLGDCARTFIAQSGTLAIATWGESGGRFAGTLSDVVLVEVEIAGDFTSTVVPGGETWCLPSYAFDAEVQ